MWTELVHILYRLDFASWYILYKLDFASWYILHQLDFASWYILYQLGTPALPPVPALLAGDLPILDISEVRSGQA